MALPRFRTATLAVALAMTVGCSEQATTPTGLSDSNAPTVAIASPPDGAEVSGTVSISGTGWDDETVAQVELQVDSGAWLPATGTTSWSVALDTRTLADGVHVLQVRATDGAGNTGQASMTITVSNTPTADFPGHQPGKLYLGYGVDNASCPQGSTEAKEITYTGAIGLSRFYSGNVNSTASEVDKFERTLAASRFPWISFKGEPYTWAQIASGAADGVLEAKAVAFQGVSGPGFITFHHEPNGDGDPADYVAAWHRILDVWQAAGGTGEITPVPVLNGFFQSYPNSNQGYTDDQMAAWMPDALLSRFRVIGYDGYDAGIYGAERIPVARTVHKWREWLLRRQAIINDGKKRYLALGEIGVFFGTTNPSITTWPTSTEGEFPNGYPGWAQVWARLVQYGSGDAGYVAVNYFNSIINTGAGLDWSLRARRPSTTAADQACDAGNGQPPPAAGVADATRVDAFKAALQSVQAAWVSDL